MECRCGYAEDIGCNETQLARQARRARITPGAWSAAEDGCYHSIAWPPCGGASWCVVKGTQRFRAWGVGNVVGSQKRNKRANHACAYRERACEI
jgi:hypothetical protein